MNLADILLILVIACAAFLAVRKMIRDRKSGKTCSCGCGSSNCGACKSTGKRKEKDPAAGA